ncbi:MAG: HIT family protein [Candidatus Woesearchaeota archaeon]
MSEPLYSDNFVEIKLSDAPCTLGHILVLPKNKVKTMIELEDKEFEQIFFDGSYSASALFELLGAQGTNVIFTELNDKLEMQIIARKENDGLNFVWAPTQISDGELNDVAKKIKDDVDMFIWQREHPEEVKKSEVVSDKKVELSDNENILVRNLFNRRP